jgi:hypothetical protein
VENLPPDPLEEINKKSKGEEVIEEAEKVIEEIKLLDLEELQKPSKGEKLIRKIREGDLYKKTKKDGVEVVEGKAIEKKGKPKDKYGLPIPEDRKNWDSI